MVQEFDGSNCSTKENDHHEQKPGVQNAFSKDVLNTVSSFEELANPFLEEGENLMAIHTKDIMDDAVLKTVSNARKIGGEQFNLFVNEQFVDRSKSVMHPLKKNNLPTFSTPSKKIASKDKAKVEVLKEDCAIVKTRMETWKISLKMRTIHDHHHFHSLASLEEDRSQT